MDPAPGTVHDGEVSAGSAASRGAGKAAHGAGKTQRGGSKAACAEDKAARGGGAAAHGVNGKKAASLAGSASLASPATTETSSVPAEVSAGVPDDVGEGCVALDAGAVLKARSRSFALRVRGCSMIGAGIEDGDIVVGEFSPSARAGAVVVALIDGQSTLKRFVTRGGRPCLVSENPNCPDPVAMSELVIQGVVHTVVKRVAAGS